MDTFPLPVLALANRESRGKSDTHVTQLGPSESAYTKETRKGARAGESRNSRRTMETGRIYRARNWIGEGGSGHARVERRGQQQRARENVNFRGDDVLARREAADMRLCVCVRA